jgi:hypothetical protein
LQRLTKAFRTESNPTPVEFLDDTFNTKIVIVPKGSNTIRIFKDEDRLLNLF